MKSLVVEAKVPEKKQDGRVVRKQISPVQITVQTGETASEMIKMFGEEAVKSNSDANWTVTLQSNIRARLLKGESAEQIQAGLGQAKMGCATKGTKVDPIQAYLAMFSAAPLEKQKEMLRELQKKAAVK